MRYFSDFLAFVRSEDFEAATNGDEAAKERIAAKLDGVDLYFHIGPVMGDGYVGVTLADLLCHGIVRRVTLHKDE